MTQRLTIRGEGVDLAADALGPEHGPRVLFLHGGGQTRQSWGNAVEQAARRGFRAITIDLRGHGESGWSPDGRYELALYAADLRCVINAVGGEPILVGASLGGLTAMMVTASPPPRVRALVLVDVTPRIEPEGAKEIGNFMASAPNGFASLEEAADAVAAYLPHRPRPRDTSGLQRNLRLRNGRYHWHWDPAMLNMHRDRDLDIENAIPAALEEAAAAVKVPTLLVRGGRSRVVSDEGVRDFLRLVPHAEVADIAGAHHMVAGDANDAFNQAISAFLERQYA
jgi:pimeloyl-ACP methyl ester carboxylesterase